MRRRSRAATPQPLSRKSGRRSSVSAAPPPASAQPAHPRTTGRGAAVTTARKAADEPGVAAPPAAATESGHPSFAAAFALLAAARLAGTLAYPQITDCDETFNYWEPTHYMLYGSGMQTWEYSPEFAFRSYAYLGLHALVAALTGGAWGADKIAVFQRTRLALALLCAGCEAYFYSGVARRLGGRTGLYTLLALTLSAGMVHAAPSFLPSTFSMYGLLLAWGAWLHGRCGAVVAATALALLLGWPFAVVCIVPFGLHFLLTRSLWTILGVGLRWSALILGVSAVVDYWYYQRWLVAAWHIVLYNAFGIGGTGAGADIYGVEPWWFYGVNLVLNFNVLFILAAGSPLAVALAWGRYAMPHSSGPARAPILRAATEGGAPGSLAYLTALTSQLWLWVGFMSRRPHKEERFMFIAFPLVCVAAAVTLSEAVRLLEATVARCWRSRTVSPTPGSGARAPRPLSLPSRLLVTAVFLAAAILSASRLAALVGNYSAPFRTWSALGRFIAAGPDADAPTALRSGGVHGPSLRAVSNPTRWVATQLGWGDVAPAPDSPPGVRVCVGKEWYRFPSAFFLPEATRPGAVLFDSALSPRSRGGPAQLSFIKSGFGGLLPQPYLPFNGSSTVRSGFNDRNEEDLSRYVPVQSCDYVIDFKLPLPRSEQQHAHLEPFFSEGGPLPASAPCGCEPDEAGTARWRSIYETPFLHAGSTPQLARSFWIPGYSVPRGVWGSYHVIQRLACPC